MVDIAEQFDRAETELLEEDPLFSLVRESKLFSMLVDAALEPADSSSEGRLDPVKVERLQKWFTANMEWATDIAYQLDTIDPEDSAIAPTADRAGLFNEAALAALHAANQGEQTA